MRGAAGIAGSFGRRSIRALTAVLLSCVVAGAWLWNAGEARGDLRTSPAWFDENAVGTAPDWHYRVPINVPAGVVANQVMRFDVDFTPLLAQMGVSGAIDANSIRVTRADGSTVVSGDYNDARYAGAADAAANNRGEVRFILATDGAATYYLYFDLTANGGPKPVNNAINSGFESGGTGTTTPSGWTMTRTSTLFDAQIRHSESPSITTDAGSPATVVTDGTPFAGNFSYLMGARSNNEPSSGTNRVVLTKTFVKPAACADGFSMRYRIEGWDSSWGNSTQYDFFRVTIASGTSVVLMGPNAPGANGNYANFPYSPNFGSAGNNAVSNTQSGYGPYNGFDTRNDGTHTLGMTVSRGDQPWFTLTHDLAAFATGSTVTLTITANHTTSYRSWMHIDDVEWCLVTGATLGSPEAFGINITAPTDTTEVALGSALAVTVSVNADPLTMSAQIINPSGAVVATAALTDIGGGVWQNNTAYTFGAGDPAGTWRVRVLGYDGSTSTVGATNGLIRIVGQPNAPEIQANFYNIDEQTFVVTSPLGRYNAWDLPLPGAGVFTPVTGKITTKVAGVAFRVGIARLNAGRTAIENTTENNVAIALLDTSNNSGAMNLATGCRASWTTVIASQTVNLAAGKGSSANFVVNQAFRDVRVRIVGSQGTACSQDNFAIRPQSFTATVSDAGWETAGTGRTLNATAFNAGPAHKAGRPFTVRITSVLPAGATNYLSSGNHTGIPTLLSSNCALPSGGVPSCSTCSNGILALGSFSPVAGPVLRTDTATYSEAGLFTLQMHDTEFAAVDIGDGTPDNYSNTSASNFNQFGRRVPQAAALTVGRFVPDHFVVTPSNAPVFQTFGLGEAGCNASVASPRRSFTYIGQPFGYATAPVAGIEARNSAGTATTNYRECLWRITASDVVWLFANTPARTLDATGILAPVVTPGNGTGTIAANAADRLAFTRDNATPALPFDANLALTVSVSDASQAEGTISTLTAATFNGGGSGIAFDSGTQFRYGRLRLGGASGSQLLPLRLPVEAQYWDGSFYRTNAADHCTGLVAGNIGLGNYLGNLNAGETAATVLGSPLLAGRTTVRLSAPGTGNNGSVDVAINLGGGVTVDACPAFAPAATAGNRAYLRGAWCAPPGTHTKDPVARARFGIQRSSDEAIYSRETTN